jgi:hypothetical protein
MDAERLAVPVGASGKVDVNGCAVMTSRRVFLQ